MRTILEILGRIIIGFSNIVLLVFAEPYIKNVLPVLAPYSMHIMYTLIVILGIWIINPLADFLYDRTHKHQETLQE